MGLFSRKSPVYYDAYVKILYHDGDLDLGASTGRHPALTHEELVQPLYQALARATTEGARRIELRDSDGLWLVDHMGSLFSKYEFPGQSSMLTLLTDVRNVARTTVSIGSIEFRTRAVDEYAIEIIDRLRAQVQTDWKTLNTLASVTSGEARQSKFDRVS